MLAAGVGVGTPFGGVAGFWNWNIANLFASQASYDASPSAGKTLLTQAVAQSLGIGNSVAITNPPGTVTLKDGTLGYGAHNLLAYSADFSNWSLNNSVTLSGAGTAFSYGGATIATSRFTANGTNNGPYKNLAVTPASGVAFTVFGFVRRVSGAGSIKFGSDSGTNTPTLLNPSTGGLTGGNSTAKGSAAVGDGWLVWATYSSAGTTPNTVIYGNTASTVIDAAMSAVYGPAVLDYVPTTTAAVYGPRFTHDKTNSTYFGLYGVYPQAGLLREVGRTNLALWCRDLTNAAWTASSVTVAKTATGIDGVANSASTLTASGANGTVLQAITSGSAARITSAYVRRKTGTGVINMTQDNGTTWTVITPQAYWSQIPIPSATTANPTIGFRIVTSGDAIEVDYVQHELGAFVTSPILTTSAAVARDADLDVGSSTLISAAGPQTVVMGMVPIKAATGSSQIALAAGNNGQAVVIDGTAHAAIYDGTNVAATSATLSDGVPALIATRWGASAIGVSLNGGTINTSSFDGSMGAGAAVGIGDNNAGGAGFSGLITRISIASRAANDADLQAASAGTL